MMAIFCPLQKVHVKCALYDQAWQIPFITLYMTPLRHSVSLSSHPVLVVLESWSRGPTFYRGSISCTNNWHFINAGHIIAVITATCPTMSICFKWPPKCHLRGKTPPPGTYGYSRGSGAAGRTKRGDHHRRHSHTPLRPAQERAVLCG